jgi:hypothetical protein
VQYIYIALTYTVEHARLFFTFPLQLVNSRKSRENFTASIIFLKFQIYPKCLLVKVIISVRVSFIYLSFQLYILHFEHQLLK